MKIQQDQFKQFTKEQSPVMKDIIRLIHQYDGVISENHIEINFPKICNDFYAKTGFHLKIETTVNKITVAEHAEMIKNSSLPLATLSDHDLIVHVLPVLNLNINFSSAYKILQQIENPHCRAWAMEPFSVIPYYCMEAQNYSKEFLTKTYIRFLPYATGKASLKKNNPEECEQIITPAYNTAKELILMQVSEDPCISVAV